jgi:hypothetical protein
MSFAFVRVLATLSCIAVVAAGCGSPDSAGTEALGTSSAPLSVYQWTKPEPVSDNRADHLRSVSIATPDQKKIVLVHSGASTNSLWWSTFDGASWDNNSKIPDQLSKAGPRVAAFNNTLYMFHVGDTSDEVWVSRFDTGSNAWKDNFKIGMKSSASPALVEYDKHLYIVGITPGTHQLWVSTMDAGEVFTAPALLAGMFSNLPYQAGPGLAVHNDRLFMTFIPTLGDAILITSLDPGKRAWSRPAWIYDGPDLQQKSHVQPAMASYQGNLHMIATIPKGLDVTWTYSADGITWSHPVTLPNQTMIAAASLVALPDRLVMAHPCGGGCDEIQFSVFQ